MIGALCASGCAHSYSGASLAVNQNIHTDQTSVGVLIHFHRAEPSR